MNRLEKEKVLLLIRRALREDIGKGDITTEQIVPEDYRASVKIKLKEKAVLSGLEIAGWVFNEIGNVEAKALALEGVWLDPESHGSMDIISLKGDVRAILMGERVALNFISRMSGISTLTRR